MKALPILLWINLAGVTALASGDLQAASKLQVDGVFSLGYMMADDNRYLGPDDGDDTLLSENVLRLTRSFDNGFALSGQIIYRDETDSFDNGIHLDFLQLDYRQHWWGEGQQTLTLGRFKSRQGLYNESRDIPMTRPSIILPQSVYLDIARNFLLSLDGVRFEDRIALAEADITVQLAAGKSHFDDKFSEVTLGKGADGDWDSGVNYYLDLRYEGPRLTAGINYNWSDIDYQPDPGAQVMVNFNGMTIPVPLASGHFDSRMITYTLQYFWDQLEVTAERNTRTFDTRGFYGTNVGNSQSRMSGEYLQLRYRPTQKWSLLARFDNFYVNADDKNGDSQAAAGNDRGYARSITRTLGLTWEPDNNWHLALEHHWISGAAWFPPIGKGIALPPLTSPWKMSAVQLSYRF